MGIPLTSTLSTVHESGTSSPAVFSNMSYFSILVLFHSSALGDMENFHKTYGHYYIRKALFPFINGYKLQGEFMSCSD